MSRFQFTPFLVVLILVGWLSGPALAEVQWQTDLRAGINMAQGNNRLVFLEVSAPWCPSCRKLDKLMQDKRVGQFLDPHFVSVKLSADSPQGQSILRQYGLKGIPALIVLGPQGDLKGKMSGAPQDFTGFQHFITNMAGGEAVVSAAGSASAAGWSGGTAGGAAPQGGPQYGNYSQGQPYQQQFQQQPYQQPYQQQQMAYPPGQPQPSYVQPQQYQQGQVQPNYSQPQYQQQPQFGTAQAAYPPMQQGGSPYPTGYQPTQQPNPYVPPAYPNGQPAGYAPGYAPSGQMQNSYAPGAYPQGAGAQPAYPQIQQIPVSVPPQGQYQYQQGAPLTQPQK